MGYFADQTPEGAGRWVGSGTSRFGLVGAVQREDLEALLRGEHPRSGEALLPTRSAARRSESRSSSELAEWGQQAFTFREAGELVGVSERYLRKVAGRTRGLLARTGGDTETLDALFGSQAFLVAEQSADGRWRVSRDELLRFMSTRRGKSRVIGYDVTFSVPKSVSLLWARGDAATRALVLAAFDRGVDAGVAYLERQGVMTGRDSERARGRGLTGAAFTHLTSRALDPQVHAHVVAANVTERIDGSLRAVAGRGLFEHAKTAGYLAGAQMCTELTARLGVGWRPVRSGIVEVAGVPRQAIEVMSTRRAEIDAAAESRSVTSAAGRRALALQTRSVKQVESLRSLQSDWDRRLDDAGFDASDHAACLDRRVLSPPTRSEVEALFDDLVRHDGLTAHSAAFTRHEVVQAIAEWSIERLDATNIESVADEFLADPRVLQLGAEPGPPSSVEAERWFTTRTMVAAEIRVLDAFRRGIRTAPATIDPAAVRSAITCAPFLSDEQCRALEQLCRSPNRVQCLVGPAGSGKTALLAAANAAWVDDNQHVIGVAVQGTAAENLQRATGIDSETLARFLARVERGGPDAYLRTGSLVVVDEASTVGTFDLARLFEAVESAGARVVLVGDPAQHGAVTAGGGFASLTRRWSHLAPRLSGTHRQDGAQMANVRAAVDELRRRDTDTALHRLVVDGRVHNAESRAAVYDAIVRDWATDRAETQAGGPGRRVCMITDDHRTRSALIARARAHLQATGELTGPVLRAGRQEFQAGDEVIARAPARDLHPEGALERHVRNGTRGRVVSIDQVGGEPAAGMRVDFEHRGVIYVPRTALEAALRRGVTGVLTHSYALTSHAAQGATYETARMVATAATAPAALYVGASRGRADVGLYTAPHHDAASTDVSDPSSSSAVVRDRESGLQSLARAVRNRGEDCLAIDRDPTLAARLDTRASPRGGLAAPALDVAMTPARVIAPDADAIVASLDVGAVP